MQNSTFIFCISVNCSKITQVMLKSFHRHHPTRVIHVMGTPADFNELGAIAHYPNTRLIDISQHPNLLQKFKQGHSGTAHLMAMVLQNRFGSYNRFVHVDSDVYFKKESISVVEEAFGRGADVVGTRRCYGNNPSGITGLQPYADTISTYFFGMQIGKTPPFDFEKLCRYCEGAEHPLGWPVLDFFDGVTHATMNAGGRVHYLSQDQFGSQNTQGKKHSKYPTNMHMDCGSHLIHFGGVGSGYAYFNGISSPEASYATWAAGRWALFAKFFYETDIDYHEPTKYGDDGRWVNGTYDEKILKQLQVDMEI